MKANFDSKQQASGLANALTTRRPKPSKDQPLRSVQNSDNVDSHAVPTSSHDFFVIPRGRGDCFQASIRRHILDLADPCSGHALASGRDEFYECAYGVRCDNDYRRADLRRAA
jgi:hypothetical protein